MFESRAVWSGFFSYKWGGDPACKIPGMLILTFDLAMAFRGYYFLTVRRFMGVALGSSCGPGRVVLGDNLSSYVRCFFRFHLPGLAHCCPDPGGLDNCQYPDTGNNICFNRLDNTVISDNLPAGQAGKRLQTITCLTQAGRQTIKTKTFVNTCNRLMSANDLLTINHDWNFVCLDVGEINVVVLANCCGV